MYNIINMDNMNELRNMVTSMKIKENTDSNIIIGKITKDNIQVGNREYALRCNPNKNRNISLWNKLLNYEVKYKPESF